jgi:predicted glycosyltransferase
VRVWIDCSNSPHPLLFAPVARRLEELGHEVLVTVRDHAQTVELARERWRNAEVVDGAAVPLPRLRSATEIGTRSVTLLRWARRSWPDVALSHNSYAQIAAARAARIRVVTAMDYEYQPANHLAFRLAHRILLPEVLPADIVERQGATPAKVRRYDGFKEELYLADFEPDPRILERLGIARPEVLVVARTGATRAAYHGYEDRLLLDALARLGRRPEVTVVVLVRLPEHRQEIEALRAPNLVLADRAVDARSLLLMADAFIGAGGTMTREAALLGTDALSVFGGREAAVDRLLVDRGLLRRLRDAAEAETVQRRAAPPTPLEHLRARSRTVLDAFVAAAVALGDS